MSDSPIEMSGAAFMASTSNTTFYKGFDARIILGETSFGKGIIIWYIDNTGTEMRKVFPVHTIQDWYVRRTVSKRGNVEGFKLRLVVPLPDHPGRQADWRQWHLTIIFFTRDGYENVRSKCRELGFPGSGHYH